MNRSPRLRLGALQLAAIVGMLGIDMGTPRRQERPPGRPFREEPDERPTSAREDVGAPTETSPVPSPYDVPARPIAPSHIALQRASRVACDTEIAAQQKRARKAARRLAELDASRHKPR